MLFVFEFVIKLWKWTENWLVGKILKIVFWTKFAIGDKFCAWYPCFAEVLIRWKNCQIFLFVSGELKIVLFKIFCEGKQSICQRQKSLYFYFFSSSRERIEISTETVYTLHFISFRSNFLDKNLFFFKNLNKFVKYFLSLIRTWRQCYKISAQSFRRVFPKDKS